MTPEHLPTEQYEAQLAEKVVRLQSMMAPFSDLVPEVFRSPVSHYRMRAEFRIWHDGDDLYHIIFDQQTKSRIRVDSFPAASELINQLMTAMIAGVRNNPVLRHKLFQIDYLTTLSNQAVVSLLYHKKLDDEWRQEAEALRDALRAQNLNVHLIGRATKTKIELDQEYMQYHKIGARIIAKDSGSWFSVFRIDKGSDDGIKEDMNVIAGGGLVGIVTDVGANYATVRSIIDDSSRVSAMAQQSGDSCIVAGDLQLFKEGRLKLSYMEKDDDIKDGDMIVTSNISGKFLPGILVGYATDITVDYNDNLTKSGYLIPAARFDRLQEVLVITDLKDAGPEINE